MIGLKKMQTTIVHLIIISNKDQQLRINFQMKNFLAFQISQKIKEIFQKDKIEVLIGDLIQVKIKVKMCHDLVMQLHLQIHKISERIKETLYLIIKMMAIIKQEVLIRIHKIQVTRVYLETEEADHNGN